MGGSQFFIPNSNQSTLPTFKVTLSTQLSVSSSQLPSWNLGGVANTFFFGAEDGADGSTILLGAWSYTNFGDDIVAGADLWVELTGEERPDSFKGLSELEEAVWSFASLFRRIYHIFVSIPTQIEYRRYTLSASSCGLFRSLMLIIRCTNRWVCRCQQQLSA